MADEAFTSEVIRAAAKKVYPKIFGSINSDDLDVAEQVFRSMVSEVVALDKCATNALGVLELKETD